ncbi:MAG: NPCBM/NEW2 domain-containing protein, partial [Bacteroidia bacterium]|nr:NPCBM/NEW2 domain-containing protein [Bacteroidia bacterium]
MKPFLRHRTLFIACLMLAGQFFVSHKLSAQEYNLKPLFDKYGMTIRDQAGRGTCSVFAIVGLMEFEFAHRQNQKVNLSVEYLNWASNQITGETEDGSFFSDALAGLHKYGICEDSLFPYYSRNYTRKVEPSGAAIKDGQKRKMAENIWIKEWDPSIGMTEDQIQQVKAQIRMEHPVAIGFLWPKNEEKYRTIVNGIMVGYKDDLTVPGGGYFVFRNSHGKGYGEEGYGKMPYEYVSRYANDGVSVRVGNDTGKIQEIGLDDLDTTKIEQGQGASNEAISKWLITLDGDAAQFTAEAGLDSKAGEGAMTEFLVLGDRKILWQSGNVKAGDKHKTLKVNLKGIKKLGLLIFNKGETGLAIAPKWTNGSIRYRGNMPFASDNRVVRGPEEIRTPLTPPMGLNSWYIYYSRVSDSIMRRAADKMIESGMADFGYQYVNIDDCWAIRLSTAEHWEYARPGAWNDPDYILIGWFRNALKEEEFEKTNLTPDEQYAYMTMWSMMAAPLIYSGEMSLLDPFTLNILCNSEVIGINQDVLGKQARIIRKNSNELIMV